MNSKRRMRAVFLSTLVVFACLTAIPAPSEAIVIKWWLNPPQYPMVGDPDQPDGGGWMIRVRGSYYLLLVNTRSSSLSTRYMFAFCRIDRGRGQR